MNQGKNIAPAATEANEMVEAQGLQIDPREFFSLLNIAPIVDLNNGYPKAEPLKSCNASKEYGGSRSLKES